MPFIFPYFSGTTTTKKVVDALTPLKRRRRRRRHNRQRHHQQSNVLKRLCKRVCICELVGRKSGLLFVAVNENLYRIFSHFVLFLSTLDYFPSTTIQPPTTSTNLPTLLAPFQTLLFYPVLLHLLPFSYSHFGYRSVSILLENPTNIVGVSHPENLHFKRVFRDNIIYIYIYTQINNSLGRKLSTLSDANTNLTRRYYQKLKL